MGSAEQPLPVQTVPSWRDLAGLEHGFFTRRGGVSTGAFAELNLSFNVGDTAAFVSQNWSRVRSHVGPGIGLVTMNQVHGARVAVVSSRRAQPEEADAMVSTAPGVGLGILTADCVPILLVAPGAGVVAAVHAGWRGTVGGVAVATIREILLRSDAAATGILAALGPAIGPCCYEVDESIVNGLESRWGAMPSAVRRYVRDGEPKARLDLRSANAALLTEAGLEPDAIIQVGGCTSCGSRELFSHRSAAVAGTATGRQLSFIGWSG